jgi:ATP-dependent Lon protease
MEPAMETARYELPNLLRARAEECRTPSAPAGAPLLLAETLPVYDVGEIDERLGEEGTPRSEALRALYGRMKRAGEMRYVVRPTTLSALDKLYASCTNFAKSLARALCTGFEFVPMASLTAGWILSGASPQWSNARPGKVAEALIQREFANPLFVLDEIDKAGGDSRYDPLAPLYTLLEPETAQRFVDEFVDIELDASHILWIATANDARSIPEPILSRMNVYTIERPDTEGAKAIAAGVYRELLTRNRWKFEADPRPDVLEALGSVAPREMRKLLVDAMGTAKLAGRDHLECRDLALSRPAARQRIGF